MPDEANLMNEAGATLNAAEGFISSVDSHVMFHALCV